MDTKLTVPAHAASLTLPDLLGLLELACSDDPRNRVSTWIGRPQPHPEDRVFGGLLLAQSLVAAGRTADPEQRVVSLQADFVAGVPTGGELRWEVERVSEAPSLCTRRSRLVDDAGNELFCAVSRWARVREDQPSYSAARPVEAPNPEGLPDLADRFADDERIPPWWRMARPVHFRHVEDPPYLAATGEGDRRTTFLRAAGSLPEEHVLRAALAAYVTDMSVLEPAFVALRAARHAPGARILSLTHALTFHAQPDLGEWHQFDCRVESVANGRAHGVGELFDPSGRHVATAAQVGLLKVVR
ncbi:acyl-CoA thioesterase [Saccharopolyspora karakumensis]|uniref:acyl-CoA thioesterase n=1 Tax=Saccharopolyspora karakumensis TaxID=2530386 RepID=UPI0014052907|nr:acyl-CoA thioesterase domain-containing protein [Saccharopolyspora karakumensis]